MRVLTVRQPWASAIVHLGKDTENRSTNIAGSYRGLLAIHAGLAFDETMPRTLPAELVELFATSRQYPAGQIIGVVELVGVHHFGPDEWGMRCGGLDEQYASRLCSPWAFADSWHLRLTRPRALLEPIPARGRLGLWRPDPYVSAALTDQLAAMAEQNTCTGCGHPDFAHTGFVGACVYDELTAQAGAACTCPALNAAQGAAATEGTRK